MFNIKGEMVFSPVLFFGATFYAQSSRQNKTLIEDNSTIAVTSLVAQKVKASAYNVGDPGSIPELGRSPGEGNGNPLQYSYLENPMDLEAYSPWDRKESDKTERFHFHFQLLLTYIRSYRVFSPSVRKDG